ncbi:hypothetical protein ACE5IS_04380 [Leptospira wolffii]|uniref:Uncharacterized protein n=1 Tax=Leptospira wolffii TaxID=409998 RepID=A0A2M9ZCY3_9LEPT|nr:hypothetical protein [Leptospira wolffii]PJZ66285.1 hypothetical protein CH371_08370 [Leptospira wolffii]TGK60159.1 hypothetical protein EHQ32_09665 [Leptospira wolffii]TGK72501.1 hypothetical protein EHQ27_08590 [Leptospira wolffii]TGK76166.1 hypothetical protein EHQ35_02415 [Leptospira wolffii]TGL30418.1 hypothetical protein EHQ57_08385 [Leptospira wolffii]
MKSVTKYSFILLFLLLGTTASGQNNAERDGKQSGSEGVEFYPLAYYDDRLLVKDVSFFRRHSDNGKGEFMDVLVELENRDFDAANFAVYILAVNETSKAKVDDHRDLVPFPKWRNYDVEEDTKVVNFHNLVPVKLDNKAVWGEKRYGEVKKGYDDRIAKGEKVKMPNPSLNELMHYLTNNPKDALPIVLYGEEGPPKDKVLISNYVAQTPEDLQKQKHDSLSKHTYTIYNAKYKTSIFSHHYTEYRPGYFTFNKVVVLIFNPQKEKNKLVYRKIIDINGLKLVN